jgi:hypothetical protein
MFLMLPGFLYKTAVHFSKILQASKAIIHIEEKGDA